MREVEAREEHTLPEATMAGGLAELDRRRSVALGMGGPARVARQHASGRLTVRERIALLIDEGSWLEVGMLALPETRVEGQPGSADGIVTGWAAVDGRRVAVIAVDATVFSGATGFINLQKQQRLTKIANKAGIPIITLVEKDGGRMPDMMGWRFSRPVTSFRELFAPPTDHPRVPRLCAALGPCYGDSSVHAITSDVTVMTKDSSIALSGPEVARIAMGESTDHLSIGGAEVSAGIVGAASLVVEDEPAAIQELKRFLSYLPDHAAAPVALRAPLEPRTDPEQLLSLVPVDTRRAYDMRKVLDAIVDADSLCPWRPDQGKSLITAFACIDGYPVGVVANQPIQRAGILDSLSLEKHIAFLDLCDTFNLPLVMFQDLPGVMIGGEEERRGILRQFGRAALRIGSIKVPKISVVLRKSFGAGQLLMGGLLGEQDLLVGWTTAQLGFMSPEAGVATLRRAQLEALRENEGEAAADALFSTLVGAWSEEAAPWEAASHFYLDDVIDPRDTRRVISTTLGFLWGSGSRVTPTGCGGTLRTCE